MLCMFFVCKAKKQTLSCVEGSAWVVVAVRRGGCVTLLVLVSAVLHVAQYLALEGVLCHLYLQQFLGW